MLKINLKNSITWNGHRSGWKYVIDLLYPYHTEAGIILDGFIDASFGFDSQKYETSGIIPYSKEWIGFWHHPIHIPPWLNAQNLAPGCILQKKSFQQSLPYCRGIFTFSEYLASFLQERLAVPIESLYHPTEFPELTFNFDAFLESRQILQIGSWLRRLTSFYSFSAPGFKKLQLLGKSSLHYLKLELNYYTKQDFYMQDVGFLPYLSNDEYDELLSESIVFVDLYDSSVNNTVIECLARNTPILVNKIAPVVEYLGEDYPLYYENLNEIPEKIKDIEIIFAAHQYLKNHPIKKKLTGDFFLQSLAESDTFSVLKHPV